MSLINKEKVLNGVGKAVDITNKMKFSINPLYIKN